MNGNPYQQGGGWYPPQGYPYPYQPYPHQPPRKRHTGLIVLAALLAFLAMATAARSVVGRDEPRARPSAAATTAEARPAVTETDLKDARNRCMNARDWFQGTEVVEEPKEYRGDLEDLYRERKPDPALSDWLKNLGAQEGDDWPIVKTVVDGVTTDSLGPEEAWRVTCYVLPGHINDEGKLAMVDDWERR